jgi:2,3-dihydroxybiphenyl 1,2-dioxygenase
MAITGLGYMAIRSDKAADWASFATGLIGMQRVDRGAGTQAFRMDDRSQRLIVSDAIAGNVIGWEVTDPAALDALGAKLDAAGVRVEHGARRLAEERQVAQLIQFQDPQGTQLEAFHGAIRADAPFRPGRPISGFRTGALGMGHAVLHVADATALVPFYRDSLGFGVTDRAQTPYPLYFFHVNGRHHSFAMVGRATSTMWGRGMIWRGSSPGASPTALGATPTTT